MSTPETVADGINNATPTNNAHGDNKFVARAKIVGVAYLCLVIVYSYSRFAPSETAHALAAWDWPYIFTVVNCTLLFAGLYFGLRKPIAAMLDEAVQKTAKNLQEARAAKTEAENLQVRKREMLAEIEREKQELVVTFNEDKQADAQRIMTAAKTEAEAIMQNVKLGLVTETKILTDKLRQQIISETLAEVEKLIDGKITERDHEKMINDFIGELNG